jgi:enoyl-CoA hydratase
MPIDDITLTIEDKFAILTLRRAHCVDVAGKQTLTRLLRDLHKAPGAARALILCATNPAAWLVNVAEIAEMPAAAARDFSHNGHRLAAAIADLSLPVIAAVDAPALGGGCELVLACDVAFAGEQAKFGQIEALGGVIPAFGGSWRLEERVGYQRALAMMFTAEIVDAETAKQYGIVLAVHPSKELLDAAKAFARRVAACSTQSVAAIKRVTRAGRGVPAAALNSLEEEAFPLLFGPEQQTRMHDFLEKQRAQ